MCTEEDLKYTCGCEQIGVFKQCGKVQSVVGVVEDVKTISNGHLISPPQSRCIIAPPPQTDSANTPANIPPGLKCNTVRTVSKNVGNLCKDHSVSVAHWERGLRVDVEGLGEDDGFEMEIDEEDSGEGEDDLEWDCSDAGEEEDADGEDDGEC